MTCKICHRPKATTSDEARAARIVELTALVETLPADPEFEIRDERLECLLCRVSGGDKFGR